jgi:PAS domain S-box-containing protein
LEDAGRYRQLVEAVTDYAIYMLDRSGKIRSWNAGAQRFKGYTASEIIGQHFSRFYTQEDRLAGLPARALEISAREGKFESEGWRVRKDGTRFWAHVVIDPIRDGAGVVIGFAKVTRDLTERRAAEQALRRSEEQFRLLVQGVTDYAIYMLSPEGIVTNWNLGAQRIKGYTPEEIIGKHFSVFYTLEDRAAGLPETALATAIREGRFEKEGWRVRKDGTRFWCHVVIDPIRDGETIIGFAKITRDVTERKQAQITLEQAREALFQSQKMDAVGQLTGGVAHDFNNLLMAVLGSLELARKYATDPKQLRLLENAALGAKRGASLTQRMLSFARKQQMDARPIDIAALTQGMTDLLQSSLGSACEIQIRIPPGLPPVLTDENQLELALLNLCVNARDAAPEGGLIVISARSENVAAGNTHALALGAYVCVAVTDNGEGMSPETLAHATEPFFTTKGVGKGTGLGLAMVHGMSMQMGGCLVLKSEMKKGTTAEIWLPVARSQDRAATPGTPSPAAASSKRTLRVLAVDDDPLVLFNTVAMLEDLGHTAVEAPSASEALKHLRERSFDLVITDQAMPKMTGMQLIEAMKAEWPDLPAVLATGYAELPGGAGTDLLKLSKPFTEQDLQSVLEKFS